MTSEPVRDPLSDPLLTPENSALIIIDYQPGQLQLVKSMDHDLLQRNIISVAQLAKTYNVPIVLSTVNVVANNQPPTVADLKKVLATMSSWIERRSTRGKIWISAKPLKRPVARSSS
jgi:nicotinamidase-related amidase